MTNSPSLSVSNSSEFVKSPRNYALIAAIFLSFLSFMELEQEYDTFIIAVQ